jgi:uncharacterized membrane protein
MNGNWVANGWWRVWPQECTTVVGGDLDENSIGGNAFVAALPAEVRQVAKLQQA